ncbi:hypothetical protein PHSC3_001729 [Chlamydiales bacterium STE3]|nr:hypothetical protein PHSC3_001729 [Chlamydiales bacterium STE3]
MAIIATAAGMAKRGCTAGTRGCAGAYLQAEDAITRSQNSPTLLPFNSFVYFLTLLNLSNSNHYS